MKRQLKNPVGWRELVIYISILVIIVLLPISLYLFLFKPKSGVAWYDGSWLYRKSISVSNDGSTLTDEDVLITVDTQALVSNNKLQNDCDDLRFVDSNDSSVLTYWIEGGCNTSSTQIWVRIPSLPNGGKTIYMYYGNSSAENTEQTWDGEFIFIADNTCPTGWENVSDEAGDPFYNKFIRGSSAYGTTGGGTTHNHTGSFSISTDVTSGISNTVYNTGGDDVNPSHSQHRHTVTGNISTEDITPPFATAILCQRDTPKDIANLIAISLDSNPSGWTRVSDFDNKFVKGSNNYNTTGGNSTHTHTISSLNVANATWNQIADAKTGTGRFLARYDHRHTVITVSNNPATNNLPPYKDIIYTKAPAESEYPISGLTVMNTAVPPLGWEYESQLENTFLRGSSTVNLVGGGSSTHTHTITFVTNEPSIQITAEASTSSPRTSNTHTHNVTLNSNSETLLPPYIDVIYTTRKTSVTNSLNTEEIYNQSPNAPTSLLTEGNSNPNSITDLTPEFSAVFSDPDSTDTGNYYQIQVNTSADFSGTSMWDSTKTAFTSPITNGSRSDDIAYNGTTLEWDTTYYWRIKMWDDRDSQSEWSTTANFTTLSYVVTPTIQAPTHISPTTIRWNFIDNSDSEAGVILLDGEGNTIKTCNGVNITYCEESSLNENTEYTRKVKSFNQLGESTPSEGITTTTLISIPPKPEISEQTTTTLKILVNPSNNFGIGEYLIQEESTNKYLNISSGTLQSSPVWYSISSLGNKVTVTGLSPAVQYIFKTKARNLNNVESAYSESTLVETLLTTPSISATNITNSGITWVITDGNSTSTGYQIFDSNGSLIMTCMKESLSECRETNLSANNTYTRKAKVFSNTTYSDFSSSFAATTLASGASLSSISSPSSDTVVLNILSGNRDRVQIQETTSNRYFNRSLSVLSPITNSFATTQSVTVLGLEPNTTYTFRIRSVNDEGISTDWSQIQSVTTRAQSPSIRKVERISGSSVRIFLNSNGNPSDTQYSIYDLNSRRFVNQNNNRFVLDSNERWFTSSNLGNANGFLLTGLDSNEQYGFQVRAKNRVDVNTSFSSVAYFGTKAVIINVESGLKTVLTENPDVDITNPENAQYGEKRVRVLTDQYLVADIPVLLNQDRDWKDVVIKASPNERKTVIKVTEEHGVTKPYTMYVVGEGTNAFTLCPNAFELNDVKMDCLGGVIFEGPFPQKLVVEGKEVYVSQSVIAGIKYWVADGLTGTGGIGFYKEPKVEEKDSIITKPEVVIKSSTEKIVNTVTEFADLAVGTVDGIQEADLKTVTVTTSVVTATVGATAVVGGFPQLAYSLGQLFAGILSSFGFRRKRVPYGFVYDSKSKEPVSMATVRIMNEEGKLVESSVTDNNGRFFGYLEVGVYTLRVSKRGFVFPSLNITGGNDYPISNIYTGSLEIKEDSKDIQVAVPVDSKGVSGWTRVLNILKGVLLLLNPLLFLGGISLSIYMYIKFPGVENLLIVLVYVVPFIVLVKSLFSGKNRYGKVVDSRGKGVENVSVIIKDYEFDKVVSKRVTNERGEYRFILDKGKYVLSIDDSRLQIYNSKDDLLIDITKDNHIVSKRIKVG